MQNKLPYIQIIYGTMSVQVIKHCTTDRPAFGEYSGCASLHSVTWMQYGSFKVYNFRYLKIMEMSENKNGVFVQKLMDAGMKQDT